MKRALALIALSVAVWLLILKESSSLKAGGKESPPRNDNIIMATVAASPVASNDEEVVLPTVSIALSAIVRKQESQQRVPEYALVHEVPPRGWWLPGGGVEHSDDTPVHGAVREVVEEAGSPALLPLLSSQSTADGVESKGQSLPSISHLLALEQSPGRIRFVFRGEWVDDQSAATILKSPPGDEESIEARWMTWDDMKHMRERKRGGSGGTSLQTMEDPWLRGHEPLTFYGMLENSWKEDGSIPGLPVHRISGEYDNQLDVDGVVTGAFFGRMRPNKGTGLTLHGRATLLTHFRCHLLICDRSRQKVVVDADTKRIPSSIVYDQRQMTLRKLVDEMAAWYVGRQQRPIGLLRVEHLIHSNGREATLTVFPTVCVSSSSADKAMDWVSAEQLSDSVERKLAQTALGDERGKNIHIDVLRDTEGPKK